MRDEVEYEPSAFGINIPRRITTTFNHIRRTNRAFASLGHYVYLPGIKRFDVKTDYEIQ